MIFSAMKKVAKSTGIVKQILEKKNDLNLFSSSLVKSGQTYRHWISDRGKVSYTRFKSRIVRRLRSQLPVASSPLVTGWQRSLSTEFDNVCQKLALDQSSTSENTSDSEQTIEPLETTLTPEVSPVKLKEENNQEAEALLHSPQKLPSSSTVAEMDKKEDSSPKANFARKEDNIIYIETERNSPYLCIAPQSPHELPLIKCAAINSRVRPPELVMKLNITGLKDDYYLNLLDWNAQNSIAIALDSSVCVFSAEHCRLMCEIHMNSNSKYASSIAWIKDGSCLAVGTSDGEVQLWDIETRKRLRNMCGHTSVVGALSWNNHILSSGSRLGFIHHYDVRMAHHHIGSLRHTKNISGLKWSPDGCRLASGSSDGILNIWPNNPNTTFRCCPLQSMVHPTAVKAMDWCPWQSEIVAVGGGMTDGVVRVWDTNNGSCLRSAETKSQICSLLWLACSKEIVTGHGLPKNQIVRWDFHSLTRKAEIKGHKGRVLSLAQSPCGSHIFSAAADGTACMWNISGD